MDRKKLPEFGKAAGSTLKEFKNATKGLADDDETTSQQMFKKKKHKKNIPLSDMSIMDHAVELRRRVLVILVFFVIALIGGFMLAVPVISYLQAAPLAADMPFHAFRLTDPLRIYVNFAMLVAFVLIIPVILYQLWAFVAPGLKEEEQKATLAYIPISFFFFC